MINQSSSSAGTNDASRRLDRSDQSNSRPQSPAIVHHQGMSTNHCPSIDQSSSSAGTNDASSRMDGTDLDTKYPSKSLLLLVEPFLFKNLSQLAPPWKRWEPDSNFLKDLQKWNIAHKDDKLPSVLDKVNSILESKPLQAALEFIPDIPFPAKSLVKAMVSLFLLGSVSDVSSQIPATYPY